MTRKAKESSAYLPPKIELFADEASKTLRDREQKGLPVDVKFVNGKLKLIYGGS